MKILDKSEVLCYNSGDIISLFQTQEDEMKTPLKVRLRLPIYVHSVVEELHYTLRPHQKAIRKSKRKCDVPGCKIQPGSKVLRALSKPWTVKSKGSEKLTSQIVLSEVEMAKYETKAEALEALVMQLNERPKLTLELLGRIKRPLEHGYSFDEVLEAMSPYIRRHTSKYKSCQFDEDDAHQQGALGIMDALRLDRGIAPFSSHVFRHIQTKVRREAAGSGLIKHGERDFDSHGIRGVLIGMKDGKNIFSSVQSIDAPLASGDMKLSDTIHSKYIDDPLQNLIEKELTERRKDLLDTLTENVEFSEQQAEVFARANGLVGDVETGSRIAEMLNISRQRVAQQTKKCRKKMKQEAEEMAIQFEDYIPE